MNDNQWHNLCVTRNNINGEVKLYVDAQLDGSGTSGVGALTMRSEARIGWGFDGAALFEGLIDDVRVYDVVLTEEQLQNLADGSEDPNGSSPTPDAGQSDDSSTTTNNSPVLAETGQPIAALYLVVFSLVVAAGMSYWVSRLSAR